MFPGRSAYGQLSARRKVCADGREIGACLVF